MANHQHHKRHDWTPCIDRDSQHSGRLNVSITCGGPAARTPKNPTIESCGNSCSRLGAALKPTYGALARSRPLPRCKAPVVTGSLDRKTLSMPQSERACDDVGQDSRKAYLTKVLAQGLLRYNVPEFEDVSVSQTLAEIPFNQVAGAALTIPADSQNRSQDGRLESSRGRGGIRRAREVAGEASKTTRHQIPNVVIGAVVLRIMIPHLGE